MKAKRSFIRLVCWVGIVPFLVSNVLEMLVPHEAYAATFTVDSTEDAPDEDPGDRRCRTAKGRCTLRAAIQQTNSLTGPDQVNLPGLRFYLTMGPLQIEDSLDLSGQGAGSTIIDGSKRLGRVFTIGSSGTKPTVNISGVTIENGDISKTPLDTSPGGGIYNSSGVLSLIQTTVRNNKANIRGGGIANAGMLRLLQSTVQDNKITQKPMVVGGVTDTGAGIFNFTGGIIQIIGSTISGNEATRGGGIYNGFGAMLTVTNSTISGNKVRTRGGGILNAGTVEISLSTITDNQANAEIDGIKGSGEHVGGGGIYNGKPPCTPIRCGKVSMGTTFLAANEDNNAPEDSPDCFSTASPFVDLGGNQVGVINGNCNIAPLAKPAPPGNLIVK
jgi:CSLREA domain-containing protein